MSRLTSSSLRFCLVLVATAFVVHHVAAACEKSSGKKCDGAADLTDNRCGMCGDPINMTFVVLNEVVQPFFKFNTTVMQQPQREMIYFLEKAAQQNKKFEFSSYYYSSLGYYMTAINGLEQNTKKNIYWMFSSKGVSLDKGLSSYVVSNKQTILVNYTLIYFENTKTVQQEFVNKI